VYNYLDIWTTIQQLKHLGKVVPDMVSEHQLSRCNGFKPHHYQI